RRRRGRSNRADDHDHAFVDQRGGGGPRPMPYARMAADSFNPDEAPPPERFVSLALDYCLS
ncbi:MAG: hypothetical protein ACO3FA_08825, partial [Vulcanococcus sp.]